MTGRVILRKTPYIYLASSWRNPYYEHVLKLLRASGYAVYDFKDPDTAFSWGKLKDVLPVNEWTPKYYRDAIVTDPVANQGFRADMSALERCDLCVLLMPAGRSAHLEAGFAKGASKKLIVYLNPEGDGTFTPDLMHFMTDKFVLDDYELLEALRATTY